MLRVTIEIIPHGDESQKHQLATFEICNIGRPSRSSHEDERSYAVRETHWDRYGDLRGVVVHRRSSGFMVLVIRALIFAMRMPKR